jgi:hypothetical protein
MVYVIWNNGGPQQAMGYWLKSFNKKPHPVPGVTFTVPEINNCKANVLAWYELRLTGSNSTQRYNWNFYCRSSQLGMAL